MRTFFKVLAAALILFSLCPAAIAEPALFVTGGALDVPAERTATFTGHTFYFTEEQLAQMLAQRDTTQALGRNIWREDVYFSSSEDHGQPTFYYHKADGIYLRDLFAALGVDEAGMRSVGKVTLVASDKYVTAFDRFSDLERFYFADAGMEPADGVPVEAMLAFFSANQAGSPQGLETAGQTAVPGGLEPTFMFGQTEATDHNNCNYAKYTQCVDLGGAQALAATVLGGQKDVTAYYTTADLMALGMEERSYTVNGATYLAQGLDLKAFVDALTQGAPYTLAFTTLQNGEEKQSTRRLGTDALEAGEYLLAWYAQKGEARVENETELRLYGENLSMANLVSMTLTPAKEEP